MRELTTGVPGMSAYELCVEWPAYLKVKAWLEGRLDQLKDTQSPEQFDQEVQTQGIRTMGGGA